MTRNRVLLWFVYGLSGLSGALVNFTLAWASSRYGAAALGGTLLAGMLPSLLLNLAGGSLADRVEPRRALLAGAVANALVLLAMAAVLAFWASPAVFMAGNLALSILGSLFGSAGYVLIPALFPPEELARINAQLSLADDAAHFAGPLLGAVLFSVFGPAGALLFATALAVVYGSLLLGLPSLPRNAAEEALDLRFVWAGFAYLTCSPKILTVVLFFAATNLFAAAFQVATPLYAASMGGAGAYASLLSAMNLGTTVSNLALATVVLRSSEKLIFAAGFVQGLALLGLGRSRSLPLAAAFGALNDAMANASGTVFIAYLQAKLPAELLGRAFAAVNTLAMLLAPLGFAAAPWLIERLGADITISALGAATAAVTVLVWLVRGAGGAAGR